jgi:predicted ATPase
VAGSVHQGTAPRGGVSEAPPDARSQTLTFLFTDVEGSTKLWEQFPDAMKRALERHDGILRSAITNAKGTVVKATGDGMMAVFESAAGALQACLEAQHALRDEPWPDIGPLRVRMAIHSGEAETRGGDYFGPVVNRTARIMAAGHGGQVLLSASAASLVVDQLPHGVSLADLGEHRLKDLERPERLFQLVHPDLTTEFPALSTLNRRPNNLPTQTSAFVGRDAELSEIRRRIEDVDVHLVTLTGPGGTGKTRLALRAAADQVDRFEDGVFFVDLASVTDTDSCLALIARVVGLSEARERSLVDELKRHLRGQRVLLVLDNFEQVTVAAPALVDLLHDCPGLKLLVTSREALHVRGESLYPVPPLSLPRDRSAARSADELGRFEAIQLFVERARAIRPDFHLTDDNARAVVEICQRLDGLPLAIELATARINLFSPEALLERLGSRLKLLRSGARDLPARQQTLRGTIEWSYDLLEPGEQRLFELLSVFSGGTFDEVEAVAGSLETIAESGVEPMDGVASLLDKSLLRRVEPDDGQGEPRVVMLETIREYATEQLDAHPEFAAAARQAHADYFADVAARAWGEVTGAERDVTVAMLAADVDNLRTAWRFWTDRRELDRLNQLVDSLWHVYEARGWYHATIELMNDLLGVLALLPPTPERWQQEVTLRTSLARALMTLRGYTGEVEDAFERALALFEGQREMPQLFPVLRSLASFYQYRAEFKKVTEMGREIMRLAEASGEPGMLVDGHFVLASGLAFDGDLPGGIEHLENAISLFTADGYRPRRLRLGNDPRVPTYTTLGFLLWLTGFPDRAVIESSRGVDIARQLNHPFSLAYGLYHAGFLRLWRREFDISRESALEVLQVVDEHELPIWRALGLCLLGASNTGLGDPEQGLLQIQEGIDLYQGLRTPPIFWPLVRSLEAMAYAYAGRPAEARSRIDEAIEVAGHAAPLSAEYLIIKGELVLIGPDPEPEAADAAFAEALERASSENARMVQLRAATRLYRLARDRGHPVEDRRATLQGLYDTFTEGFTTADLREAAELLASAG